MNLDQLDQRQIALGLARARAVNGLAMLLVPGIVARMLFGRQSHGPVVRALVRLVGIRDLVLGVGAINTLKEQTMDAEWVAVGALADLVDGVVALAAPGLPARTRLVAIAGGGAGTVGLLASRALADARKTSEVNP